MEIAIISGKGGTGKSSLCAVFATLDGNVVLADCDVDAANLFLIFEPTHEEEKAYVAGHKAVIDYTLCTNCTRCIDYCRFDAISLFEGSVTISEISCDGCFLCSRICPEKAIAMKPNNRSRMYSGNFRNGKIVYGRLAPGEENSGKLVSMVREKSREVAEKNGLDTIIIDGPPGIGCPVISTITGVDKVVIVTEPTISGLHDLRRSLEVVGKFDLTSTVIINKTDINVPVSKAIEEYCESIGIKVAGKLPFEPLITKAMISKMSINELDNTLIISREIQKIWSIILTDK